MNQTLNNANVKSDLKRLSDSYDKHCKALDNLIEGINLYSKQKDMPFTVDGKTRTFEFTGMNYRLRLESRVSANEITAAVLIEREKVDKPGRWKSRFEIPMDSFGNIKGELPEECGDLFFAEFLKCLRAV